MIEGILDAQKIINLKAQNADLQHQLAEAALAMVLANERQASSITYSQPRRRTDP